MSKKQCNMIININKLKMENSIINIEMNNEELGEVAGGPIFIANGDDFARSIQVSSRTAGSRIDVVDNTSNSNWILSVVTAAGRIRMNLVGTNLYLTLPSGGDKYIRLRPLGGYDNAQQYFDMNTSMDGSFTLSRDGVIVSTENQEVTAGCNLVIETPGETVYTAILGFTPV